MFVHMFLSCLRSRLYFRFGAMLLVFFFTSSMFTKFGEDKKRKLEADFKEGGQRNWYRLLSIRNQNTSDPQMCSFCATLGVCYALANKVTLPVG